MLNHGLASPQDVKLSPDGRTLYAADQQNGGVWEIDPSSFRVIGFLRTGAGAHGLYPSRNAQVMYVANRQAGSISVVSFRTRRVIRTWQLPLPASPDMGGVSADGNTLWLSGRYNARRVRDRHTHRPSARGDPGRRRPARTVRVAAARALLARAHRHPALSPVGEPLSPRASTPAPEADTAAGSAGAAGIDRSRSPP